jgi:2-phosphosulfolactate phosphatase
MRGYLRKSSHNQRLGHLNLEEDILFCLQEDKVDVVPIFKEGRIVSLYPVLV